MPSGFPRTLPVYLFLVVLVFSASVFCISDLDFWWHLKTGQVILQQHAFQHTEIYSYTAAGREYIDHEWLFQVFSYLAYAAAGPAGVIFLKALLILLIYLLSAGHLRENGGSATFIALAAMLSVCGGVQRFIERPEIYSTLYLLLVYLAIDRYLRTQKPVWLAALVPVILIWANTHAAVVLGLLIQLLFLVGLLLERFLRRFRLEPWYNITGNKPLFLLSLTLVVSFLATLINPYGFRLLKVPFELTGIIDSGLLRNEEWQRTLPRLLPFFYLSLIAGVAMHLLNLRRLSVIHFLLTAVFGVLAIRYVRNTGMFALLLPVLVAPCARQLSLHRKPLLAAGTAMLCVSLYVLTAAFPFQRGIGIASGFPSAIADYAQQKNLQGNMLNSYGFGGYLIWRLYPERKIFIDGRNEVYLPLLKEIIASRTDSRLWTALLEKYGVEYALLNYVDEMEKVTILDRDHKARITYMPFSSTHFPRSRWALVYFDDNGMVLVRRKGVNSQLLSGEYTSVFPEGAGYQEMLLQNGTVNRQTVATELQRKLSEDPGCKRALQLLARIRP